MRFTIDGAGELQFAEAVEYLREKINMPTERWTDIMAAQHARAFVVAGAQKSDLLADLREAVDSAVTGRMTQRQFSEAFPEIARRYGWRFNGTPGWRSRVIYQTNVEQAHHAGRWRQQQAVKSIRPYLRYRHSPYSINPREQHVAWNGLILHQDDPFWETHYPKNGWGCKCSVETLSQSELDEGGLTPSKSPKIKKVRRLVDGEPYTVPDGIDPGFEYNPGRASFGQFLEKFERPAQMKWLPLQGQKTAADLGLDSVPQVAQSLKISELSGKRAAVEALTESLGGPTLQLSIKGMPVTVDADYLLDRLPRSRWKYVANIKTLLNSPESETWITFVQGDSGKIGLRLSVLGKFGKKGRILILDVRRGILQAVEYANAGEKKLEALRIGTLIKDQIKAN